MLKRRKQAKPVTINFYKLMIIDSDIGMSGKYCFEI